MADLKVQNLPDLGAIPDVADKVIITDVDDNSETKLATVDELLTPARVQSITTAERTALEATAYKGQIVFDCDLLEWFGWNGSEWKQFTIT